MKWTREEFISYMTFAGGPRDMFSELMGLLLGLDKEWEPKAPGPTNLT